LDCKEKKKSVLDDGFWIPDSGRWILDAGFWKLDAGNWMLDLKLDFPKSMVIPASEPESPCLG
jgi:hypothetical protein